MTESWSVFGLPRKLRHCQVSNYWWEPIRPASLQGRVEGFVSQVLQGESPHLILTGRPGIGKSHLSVGIWRRVVPKYGTQLTHWLDVPAFCKQVRKGYGQGNDPLEAVQEARRLVVLDDLFGRDLSAHELGQILYELVDTTYRNDAAMVVTMNQSIKEAASFLRPHEVSRLLADATVIEMSSDRDFRR